jgi:hypothetical protein
MPLFTDTELSEATTYYYKVKAYKAEEESALSSFASATTFSSDNDDDGDDDDDDDDLVTLVDNKTAEELGIANGTTVNAAIANFAAQEGYPVSTLKEFIDVGGVLEINGKEVTNGSTKIKSSDRITVKIPGDLIDDGGWGDGASPDPSWPLPAPTGVTAIALSSTIIEVSWWDSSAGAAGYSIYRATSMYGDYSRVGSSPSTSYTDTAELFPSTTYYYKVCAWTTGEEGDLSEPVSATTYPAGGGDPGGGGEYLEEWDEPGVIFG